jgi:hypothetical protein
MATMIPGSAKTLKELRWRFLNKQGVILAEDDRMRGLALKYAKRFQRECGTPPDGQHPFPNPWDYTFVIEYFGPGGPLD